MYGASSGQYSKAAYQVPHSHPERDSDMMQSHEADIPNTTFHTGHKSPVHAGLFGELFLRQPQHFAALPDGLP